MWTKYIQKDNNGFFIKKLAQFCSFAYRSKIKTFFNDKLK
jgi:hypothetical protein